MHLFLFPRLSSDVWPKSQTIADDGCTSSKCFQGTFADIFTALQPLLNFTFTLSKNPVAGARLENGTWTGQIGIRIHLIDMFTYNYHQTISGAYHLYATLTKFL